MHTADRVTLAKDERDSSNRVRAWEREPGRDSRESQSAPVPPRESQSAPIPPISRQQEAASAADQEPLTEDGHVLFNSGRPFQGDSSTIMRRTFGVTSGLLSWRSRFFLILRIVRELVPGAIIPLSFYSLVAKIVGNILGESWDPCFLLPWKSRRLDMVMFALPLFWSDKHPNPNDRSRDNAIRVLRLDVFTDEMVPKDNQNWRDADEDDWWCLVFPEKSPFYVSKMDSNSTCQSLTLAMIIRTGDPSWAADFPAGDSGWRCLSFADRSATWPVPGAAPQGRDPALYSFCIDVTSSNGSYQDPWILWDFWLVLCSIPLLQLALIVNWLFQKEILGSYYGRNCPNRCKIVYCMSALIFLTVAIISVYPAKPAVFMSDENPTTPFWLWGRNKLIPIIAGFSSLKYFVLAIEDRGDFLHDIIARPFVWITLKTLGFKTKGRQYSEASFGSQWKLDSDRAICLFQARGY